MIYQEFIPIIIALGAFFLLLAIAFILKIRSKKSLLGKNNQDFIDVFIQKRKTRLNSSMSPITWSKYIAILVLCPVALAAIGFFAFENKGYCFVLAVAGLCVPEIAVRITEKKHKEKFEEKYAVALRAFASALRSGLTIEQAIDNVGQNNFLDISIRNGFRQISSDMKVGIPLADAFQNFANENGSEDAADVAAVIAMQAQVGGSEARVITTIIQNINDRIMARKEIKALFADTSMLILIMDIMPFALLAILLFGARQMIEPFFESFGMTMLLVGIFVFTVVGSFVIRKIAKNAKGG